MNVSSALPLREDYCLQGRRLHGTAFRDGDCTVLPSGTETTRYCLQGRRLHGTAFRDGDCTALPSGTETTRYCLQGRRLHGTAFRDGDYTVLPPGTETTRRHGTDAGNLRFTRRHSCTLCASSVTNPTQRSPS